MSTTVVFLIVMSVVSSFDKGFGGIEVTPMPNMGVCEQVKSSLLEEIPHIYSRNSIKVYEKELVVKCKEVIDYGSESK
jgi:hypothetical protein